MVWYSHLFQNFPQFVVIHTIKGFGVINKAEVDVFLELSCFFDDPADVGNLISGSSAFLKPAWTSGSSWFMYCWSLAWRMLSITLLAIEKAVYILYESNNLTFWKSQNYTECKKISSFQGLGEWREGWKSRAQEVFRAVFLFWIILSIHVIIYLSRLIEYVLNKTEPSCKLWTLGDHEVSMWIIFVSWVPLPWGSWSGGGGCECLKPERLWEHSVLYTQFWCEPKTGLKK